MTQRIYLDNNATTQPAPEVVAAVGEVNEQHWANPSSVHRFGQMARQRVELARASLARLINCRDRELIFTSGGTESNNLALRGVFDRALFAVPTASSPRGLLITTQVEHAAIREPAQQLAKFGIRVVYLPVDLLGRVDPQDLTDALGRHATDPGCITLASIHWANNETGAIQPIDDLVACCRAHSDGQSSRSRVYFHTDATQAVGKIAIDLAQTPVDLLTFSAHKFHGPKGVGALFVRSGVRLHTQNLGGPQERERRGGTENTPGIVGMGVAAELAEAFLTDTDRIDHLGSLRDRFEQGVVGAVSRAVIIAKPANSDRDLESGEPDQRRLWNTSNIAFPHLEAEAVLVALSERGLCASAGAACSSGSLDPSPVLLAMGIPEPVAHGAVRFSLSRHTTDQEIDRAVELVADVVKKLAKTLPIAPL